MEKQNPNSLIRLRPSRRDILRASLGVGGAAALGTTPWTPAALAQTAGARQGGTLRVCFPNAPDTLDPHLTISAPGQQVAALVYETLTELDANDQPAPRLATSWRAEKSGQEWIFELRQGVKFHHGKEFTADDVVATIQRSEDKSLGLRSQGAFGPYKEVRAEGKNTVRIVLTQPCAEVPVLVANRWARIIPADKLSTIANQPVGTGPFKFKDFQPGTSASVEKNADYWVKDRPFLDGVRVVAIAQSIAQQAALRANTVDVLEFLSADGYLALKSSAGVHAYSITVGQYYTLMTQANLPPFNNLKVRNAFKYILDRESLLASAVLGQGTVANDLTLVPDSIYLPKLEQYGQDLNKAKSLLAESGAGPLSLELYTSSERQPSPKIAVAFKEAAEKIGVNITIRDVPFTEYVANVSRKKALYTSQWNERVSLYESLFQIYHSSSPFNYSGVEQVPGLDAQLEQMVAELDLARRKAIVTQIIEKIHPYGDRIIPFFMNYMCATTTKVQNYTPPKHGTTELRDVWLTA